MQAATRLGLAFLLLITAFLVLVGFAVAGLAAAGQSALAVAVGVTGIAGAGVGVVTWLVVRQEDDEPVLAPPPRAAPRPAVIARKPVRVQAMPVADLPQEYVDAVTRGIRARTGALRVQVRELHH